MSAVSVGYCSDGWFLGVMVRWWGREEVPSGSFFVAGIICEEVLEQPRRCLACAVLWLAGVVSQIRGEAYQAPWRLQMRLWVGVGMSTVCEAARG
jgi:hypothetical protein